MTPKTYKSNFSHHDFVQVRKQHSRYKAILSPIVLLQQCCVLHLSYSSEAVLRLDYQMFLKSTPQPYWLDPPMLQCARQIIHLCLCVAQAQGFVKSEHKDLIREA